MCVFLGLGGFGPFILCGLSLIYVEHASNTAWPSLLPFGGLGGYVIGWHEHIPYMLHYVPDLIEPVVSYDIAPA